jgi:hypothetical protein
VPFPLAARVAAAACAPLALEQVGEALRIIARLERENVRVDLGARPSLQRVHPLVRLPHVEEQHVRALQPLEHRARRAETRGVGAPVDGVTQRGLCTRSEVGGVVRVEREGDARH